MSWSINGSTITLTRGDTFRTIVGIYYRQDTQSQEPTPYELQPGDSLRFAMKRNYTDPEPLINKQIPIDTRLLEILPEETKSLPFGNYVYDIELTMADGTIQTFITKAKLKLSEEVH